MTTLDTVIVGGGQAGLGVSHYLQQKGLNHVVYEQGRIGETWLSKRWDSFQLNTPNFMNTLPGLPYEGPEPNGFWRTIELVNYYQSYTEHFRLPVQTGIKVIAVDRNRDGEGFLVKIRKTEKDEDILSSRSVVIACGIQRVPKVPAIHSKLPDGLFQLHTADYRNPSALPEGSVAIIGSGQSGCQIAEDLVSAGRKVYLCTSRVGRVPRRYRGRDLLEWWVDMKHWEVTYASLEDQSISRAAQPQISGTGPLGHTLSLQYLHRMGVEILGRLLDVESGNFILGDDAAANVLHADEFSQRAKNAIDDYLGRMHIPPPPLEPDPADVPDPNVNCVSALRKLDPREADIGTLIWATGFTGDFNWIHLPILDQKGTPIHERGVSPERGLYFLGFPWLNSRKSGIIYGIQDDARFIADCIERQVT